MRVNVYSQEITSDADRVTKSGHDEKGNPALFHAVRLYLHSSPMLHNTPADDDRSAVTIWLPASLERRIELAIALRAMAAWAEGPWPGEWPGWQDGPHELGAKIVAEKAAQARGLPGAEPYPGEVEPEVHPDLGEYLIARQADYGDRPMSPRELAHETARWSDAHPRGEAPSVVS
jgi:hypothetical protein